ncbi:MAG TPA: NAD(P)-dependent oxidoreductase [Thermoanaerobaculia bacterium]|nr:NAD(P)-dependent oxidoreductase [Thermoanaerobaculia bacterium]
MTATTALTGKRVLVTGGSGFVGRHLVRSLSEAGAIVVATRHRTTPGEAPPEVRWLPLAIGDPDSIRAAVAAARPEVVFHLAALLGADRSIAFAERALRANLLGTHNLFAVLLEQDEKVERIVVMGSSEEYGRSETLPIGEEQPLHPVSPYSLSKAAASQLALTYAALYGLPVTVLRPFIIYGPGQSPTMMLPSLIETLLEERDFAMTAGEQTRDFLYVDDLVAGLAAAAVEPAAAGEALNLCSGEERSIRDVAELAASMVGGGGRLLPGALPYRGNEVWRLYGSNARARRLLEWSPHTSLHEGLKRTVEWYREHRVTRL